MRQVQGRTVSGCEFGQLALECSAHSAMTLKAKHNAALPKIIGEAPYSLYRQNWGP